MADSVPVESPANRTLPENVFCPDSRRYTRNPVNRSLTSVKSGSRCMAARLQNFGEN
jgi:hypothetical protein